MMGNSTRVSNRTSIICGYKVIILEYSDIRDVVSARCGRPQGRIAGGKCGIF